MQHLLEYFARIIKKIFLIETWSPLKIPGCLVLLGFLVMITMLYAPSMFQKHTVVGMGIAGVFFLFGCAGAISASRRELPQFIPLTGRPAFWLGVLWTVLSWGISCYALYLVAVHIIIE